MAVLLGSRVRVASPAWLHGGTKHCGEQVGITLWTRQVGERQPRGVKGALTTQVLGLARVGFGQERTRVFGKMEAWVGWPKKIGLNFRGSPAESETGRGTDGILWDCPPLLNYWHFDLTS